MIKGYYKQIPFSSEPKTKLRNGLLDLCFEILRFMAIDTNVVHIRCLLTANSIS